MEKGKKRLVSFSPWFSSPNHSHTVSYEGAHKLLLLGSFRSQRGSNNTSLTGLLLGLDDMRGVRHLAQCLASSDELKRFCFPVGSPAVATSHPIKNLQRLPAAHRVISSAFKGPFPSAPKHFFLNFTFQATPFPLQISFALTDANSEIWGQMAVGSNLYLVMLMRILGQVISKLQALVVLGEKKTTTLLWGLHGEGGWHFLQPNAWGTVRLQ